MRKAKCEPPELRGLPTGASVRAAGHGEQEDTESRRGCRSWPPRSSLSAKFPASPHLAEGALPHTDSQDRGWSRCGGCRAAGHCDPGQGSAFPPCDDDDNPGCWLCLGGSCWSWAQPISLCSASCWLWPRWQHVGELGAGVVSWSPTLPAFPHPSCVSTGSRERGPWRNKCNTSLGFSRPCSLPAASPRRVLWIYFCRYKYNVRMGSSITNNIHDTAVNGARYKVWLPGALAHAGKDDFPVSLLLIPVLGSQVVGRGGNGIFWGCSAGRVGSVLAER